MTGLKADYRTNKHIPSRNCYQLIMEVPEEDFPEVCRVIGYPKTGENTYVGIALLDMSVVKESLTTQNEKELSINEKSTGHNLSPVEKSEGDKLRVRAVMLCKDVDFIDFLLVVYFLTDRTSELNIRNTLCNICNIKSRSELTTNVEAQELFKDLDRKYKSWLKPNIDKQYADNLNKY